MPPKNEIVMVFVFSSGKPASGKKVRISCDELLTLWMSETLKTDANGCARFPTVRNSFQGKIFVEGKMAFEGKLASSNHVYM